MDALLKKQMDGIKGQQSALSTLNTKLSTFQTMLKDLNKASIYRHRRRPCPRTES